MIWNDDLLAVIDAFLVVSPLQEKTLSGRIFNDQKKIAMLRNGAEITLTRANNALIWLSQKWDDAAMVWPESVDRPEALEDA